MSPDAEHLELICIQELQDARFGLQKPRLAVPLHSAPRETHWPGMCSARWWNRSKRPVLYNLFRSGLHLRVKTGSFPALPVGLDPPPSPRRALCLAGRSYFVGRGQKGFISIKEGELVMRYTKGRRGKFRKVFGEASATAPGSPYFNFAAPSLPQALRGS
jgi:hypothetical protein